MKPFPPDRPEGRLVVMTFVRLIVVLSAAIGFLLFIGLNVARAMGFDVSASPDVPTWLGLLLLFCVLCYGIVEIHLSYKPLHRQPPREPPPTI
jgi:hypothetical protein